MQMMDLGPKKMKEERRVNDNNSVFFMLYHFIFVITHEVGLIILILHMRKLRLEE